MNSLRLNSYSALQNETVSTSKISAALLFVIIGLSFTSLLVISLLFKLALPKAFGIALIASGAISAYLSTLKKQIKTTKQKKIKAKKTFKKSDLNNNFVAMGVESQAVHKIQASDTAETKQVKEIIIDTTDTVTIDNFRVDPIGHLTETQLEIMALLDNSHTAFQKLEDVFGARLHKNTSSDISNFLLLRRLNDAFKVRLEEIIDTLDTIKKEQKLNLHKGFFLAHGPLVLANDSVSTISEGTSEVKPIEKDEWETTLHFLLKQIARKKTFHHALSVNSFR